MNREILFRAWVDSEMVELPMAGLGRFDFEGSYALSFVVDGYSGFWSHENYDMASVKKVLSEAIIMQYTGVTDKNGVKVFEGDIIKSSFTGYIYPITFEEGAFYAKKKGTFLMPSSWCTGEVIGNIHQHPNLI